MRAKSGFTLVEILIVVVILGILAAIVIPQFTDASTQANESRLCADLQTLRSQLELYKIQHKDQLPPGDLAGFTTAMTTKGADGYGPYMQKLPSNPFIDPATGDPDGFKFESGAATVPSDGLTGWWLNVDNGEVRANDNWNVDTDPGTYDHAGL
ncbi:MAG TPA: prepilin-type N-terminal cleavage/methylation domain-containing protein [Sedimentisphaerales bacterium]|nr:prepilin-type N-terminal cleavage/methylation domain-containing protein [Sedimentisphaerales bacterium]